MEKKGSSGLTIVGIAMLIYSLWLLVASGVILPLTIIFFKILPMPLRMLLKLSGGLHLITALVASVYLVCSIGILTLKNWARLLTIYFTTLLALPCIYIVLVLIITTVKGELEGPAAIGYLPILLVIPYIPFLVSLILLSRPKVKEQFK